MAPEVSQNEHQAAVRLGRPWRLLPETRQLTLLVLGHVIVFFLSMGHDEIVAELVEDGWLFAQYAERFEILVGFVLFLCWSALTWKLLTVLRQATVGDGLCAKCRGPLH